MATGWLPISFGLLLSHFSLVLPYSFYASWTSILLTFLQPGDLAVYKKAPRTDRRRPKKTSLFVPTEASFLLSCCTTHIKWMTEFRLENRKKGKIKKICMRKGFSEQRQHQTTIQNWSQTRNRHINFVAGLYNLAIFICLRKKSHKQGFSQGSGNRKLCCDGNWQSLTLFCVVRDSSFWR